MHLLDFFISLSPLETLGVTKNVNRDTYVVQFIVEAAGITNGLAVWVSSPQGCCGSLAIGATCAGSPRGRLQAPFGFYQRPRLAVHLSIEAARVAQVVAVAVAAPQRRMARAAIDALAAL